MSCGCEGNCPVCRIGEVNEHKCKICNTEFCSKCHGIINGALSENVLPCKCKKYRRNKTFKAKLVIPKENKQVSIERGDILLFRGQRHNYMRIYRPSLEKYLDFIPGLNGKLYLNGPPTYQEFLFVAILIGATSGLRVRESFALAKKFNMNWSFKLL